MSAPIRPQPGILEIELYQGGVSALAGHSAPLKLSSNENPFGPSPKAVAAARDTIADLHRYPSTDHGPLRSAIAEVHGLDADRIICGVGSDEVLTWLCQAYSGPGDEVLFTEHGFSIYRIAAHAVGATPVEVPETERATDIDALIAAANDRTRLVFIANPNNPTGTMVPLSELERLAEALPEQCLLVIDGAYAEFVPDYDGGASMVAQRENVVMTRTFSKIYGLGGLRVGWGYGPRHVIDVLNRIRGPFNLSKTALAGAEAAVRDKTFVESCIRVNAEERARLIGGVRQLGIACDDSHANFILARFADEVEADAANAHLNAGGIIVRQVKGYKLPEGLRITVGRPEDVTRVLDALASFKGAE
ncbi:MAG: histidinol-phosphate transaminase [Pseudomonadota bacterium]